MDNVLIIKRLKKERAQLCISRDINAETIERYNCLIEYYCSLYLKTLSDINENKESIGLYEDIISFKRMISSPKFLEKINIISDTYLQERIDYLDKKIDRLILEGDDLRRKATEYKERKIKIEDENARYMDEIGIVDENIKHYRLVRKKAR